MKPKPLSQLLLAAGVIPTTEHDPTVSGVTEDSREVQPGWIFVAVPGTKEDGSKYAAAASMRGAAAIVAERPVESELPVVLVPSARQTLADMAAELFDHPSKLLSVAGVTGTDGKTTTSYMLASIMFKLGIPTGMITTVETRVGGISIGGRGRLTTPSAPFIQQTLAKMVDAGDKAAVLECSSHALAQERVRRVTLRTAAITNVASDHIEFHGSPQAYLEAKAGIFDLVAEGGAILLNHDDPASMSLVPSLNGPVLTYGLNHEADLRARDVKSDLHSSTFVVEYSSIELSASIPIGGRFNVSNALAAVGMAMRLGVSFPQAVAALAHAETPPGRLQRVRAGQPFSLFVDYAHTEQAFESALRFLRSSTGGTTGRLIAVFGAAGNRDAAKRPRLAQIAAEVCDYFILTNEDPFGEDAELILAEVASGAPESTRDDQWMAILDRKEAIRSALAMARSGDVVAITGKGHETSIAAGDTAIPWSDVEVASELLTGMGYSESAVTAEPTAR